RLKTRRVPAPRVPARADACGWPKASVPPSLTNLSPHQLLPRALTITSAGPPCQGPAPRLATRRRPLRMSLRASILTRLIIARCAGIRRTGMAPEPPRPVWGWILPARVLIGLLSIAGALWLLAMALAGREPVRALPRLVVDPNTAPPQVLAALP